MAVTQWIVVVLVAAFFSALVNIGLMAQSEKINANAHGGGTVPISHCRPELPITGSEIRIPMEATRQDRSPSSHAIYGAWDGDGYLEGRSLPK